MPLQITVGPPQLIVHAGQTVWASEPDGQLADSDGKGLMFRDTRLISTWSLFANGETWELTNGGAIMHFAARVFLTNRRIPTQYGDIAPRTLSLVLGRWTDGGVHEDLDLTNHGMERVRFNLELSIRSDFADLFEVKSGRVVRRGRIATEWSEPAQCLRTSYANQDFLRAIAVTARGDSPAAYANGRLSFAIDLAPGATWHACLLYVLEDDGERLHPPAGCICHAATAPAARGLEQWRQSGLKVTSSDDEICRIWRQSVDDLAALRLPIDGHVVPAAGLPWFLALFGRDSLIVSLQTLPLTTAFAHGALAVLGARQALAMDPARDAEPGKILHELRLGELAHFKLIPHTPYYGTADATPLYLMLLHATWRWTGEQDLLRRHLDTAERCLAWIDTHGDRDGDGFQEYGTRSPQGYENLGWKDATDAVLYPDGRPVTSPKALCELQGYTYAAWTGMAEIYTALGRPDSAARLLAKAAALYNRFNDAFWDERLGFYAFALDGQKRRVLSVTSNVGHCLWTGIIRPDRARRVVEVLMGDAMFSGWGIRTLSADHVAFNPYSYHNGSVWPHDNGLIAQGLRRYGFTAELSRLAGALGDASSYFAMHQVPELFAGIARDGTGFPVQCPGANVPQAWAAGSAFSFLQAILGLRPDAPNGLLHLAPALPGWLPDITLRDLCLGAQVFDLHVRREGTECRVEVLRGPPDAVRVTPLAR
ncbi:MAG: amylo-alpha-1,6-glucosidase [Rhodospirillales bacterium 70-18]|nr:amylo-alpha-1,6-glucosidase [Rhodospirillales bacterium]OJY73221.1 MAG: amylo-alpha-1,6-glucosidase [Rhodospirillales bacterium 70-18]